MLLPPLLACNSRQDETIAKKVISVDSVVSEVAVGMYNPESRLFIWKSSPDYTKVKNTSSRSEILNADSLILGLNQLNENVFLTKVKVSGDTIYTEVKDSQYLAEGMGTTGAEIYLADVVLNLTEIPGINYVNIQMQEGSHMQPGTWSKESFAKYKPVN